MMQELSPAVQGLSKPEMPERVARVMDWIGSLIDRVDTDSLFTAFNIEVERAIASHVEEMRREFSQAHALLEEEPGKYSRPYARDLVQDRLFQEMHRGEPELITAAHLGGILANPKDIHIHQLGAGDGRKGATISHIRREVGATSVTCWEIRNQERERFAVVKELLGQAASSIEFKGVDIRGEEFANMKGKDTYWYFENPGQLINHMIDRIISGTRETLPEGMVILPCTCCCYGPESYPFQDGDCPISRVEWNSMSEMSWAYRNHMPEIRAQLQKIMDCLRAMKINSGSDLVSARVQNISPYRNIMLIKKAA